MSPLKPGEFIPLSSAPSEVSRALPSCPASSQDTCRWGTGRSSSQVSLVGTWGRGERSFLREGWLGLRYPLSPPQVSEWV